jgi:hypothetical protein
MGSVAGFLVVEHRGNMPANIHGPVTPLFFIDGHVSHALMPEGETIFGLLPARAVSHPFHRSLVLGLGSGQSALGVSMISEHTDVVEISPSVFDELDHLSYYNRHITARPDVSMIRADGTDFLRTCVPGSYDLVSSTVTYPVMFSSYKMYTAEAVRDAHHCLAPGGIYQGYIPGVLRMDAEVWKRSLAPIYETFKYVYVSTQPYLTYLASDHPLSVPNTLDLRRVIPRADDLAYVAGDASILRNLACSGWMEPPQTVRPDASTPVTTLDDPVIERDNTTWVLKSLGPTSQWLDMDVGRSFEPFLPFMKNDQCWNVNELLQPRPGVASAIHPPLIPLYRGPAQP